MVLAVALGDREGKPITRRRRCSSSTRRTRLPLDSLMTSIMGVATLLERAAPQQSGSVPHDARSVRPCSRIGMCLCHCTMSSSTAHDLPGLARFWEPGVGLADPPARAREREVVIGPGRRCSRRHLLHAEPDKVVKNRVHLDPQPRSRAPVPRNVPAEIERLIALGAPARRRRTARRRDLDSACQIPRATSFASCGRSRR